MLVIRTSALGDVAMTLPVVYSLARQYPELDVYLLTRPFFGRLCINAPANLRVIGVDLKKDYPGLKGLMRLIRELRREKFSYVADFHDVLRSWIISNGLRLSGSRLARMSKDRRGRRQLLRKGKAQKSFITRYAETLERLGFPVNLDFKSVFAGVRVETPIKVEHPAVGIAPFARYANKTYPIPQMKEVSRQLVAAGINVYLFGGKGEASELEDWIREVKGCRSVAGKLGIEDELATISHLDVMVSMDSANQHLASLVGVEAVTVWGSTQPSCGFLGYGQSASNALSIGLACQPCTIAGSPECKRGDMACMRQLPAEVIAAKVVEVLKGKGYFSMKKN